MLQHLKAAHGIVLGPRGSGTPLRSSHVTFSPRRRAINSRAIDFYAFGIDA